MKTKHLLFSLLIFMSAASVYAQGIYTPSTSGYTKGDTTEVLKIYGPFGDQVTYATVGVYYTKGASEDSTTTVQLLSALDATAINAGYGEVLSTDASLQFGNSAASEYQEQTITLNGGQRYLALKYKPVGTATDTTNVKILLYLR